MSKIKSDFITNSSSSSFVVAIKNGTTLKDVEKYLKESVEEFVEETPEEYLKYTLEDFDIVVLRDGEDAKKEDMEKPLLKAFAKRLLGMVDYSIDIDDWKVTSEEFGNEDGYNFSSFMYYNLRVENNDKIKIKGFS
ncbi:MAG: hypothetical protein WA061_02865 [Microgenomates group bacterium]